MIQKLLALLLLITMSFSVFVIPVEAEETKSFYADFDSYSVGAIGKNANVNGTGSKLFSSWFSIINEATGNTTDSYINRTNFTTDTELVSDGGNDKSLKITVPATESAAVELHAVTNLTPVSDTYIHFGYNIKLADMDGRSIWLYYNNNSGRDYDFTTFGDDGILKFNGISLGKYVTDKWYNFDVYYNATSGVWVVYLNGKLELITTSKLSGMTNISKLIFKLGGSGKAATSYIDDLCICTATSSELQGADKASAVDYIPFTNNSLTIDTTSGKNYDAVDSKNLLYKNYEDTGYVKYEYKGGVFGKEVGDKSLHIYNPAGYQGNSKFGYVDYEGFDSSKIIAGAKLHYSTLFAIDNNTSSDVWLEAIMNGGAKRSILFNTKSDGSYLSSIGQGLNKTVKRNQWYKLDFIITVGETGVSNNALDVYINGKKANNSTIEFSAGTADKTALTSLIIRTANYQTEDKNVSASDAGYVDGYKKYKSDSFWLDDITALTYSAENSIISPSVDYSCANVTPYYDRIENIGNTTVAELIGDTFSPKTPFFVADTNGAPVSDTSVGAKGKTLVFNPLIGGNIYIPIYHIPLPSGYTDPTVEITSPMNGAEFVYGIDESCTIEAIVSAYSDIESVSFYLDGNLLNTDTSAPYEYNWTIPDDAGSHTIMTSVTDSYGTNANSEEIDITIISNEAPTVTFSGLSSENNISFGEDLSFTLIASDADGSISKTELYINNEKYDTFIASSSKSYNISFPSIGRYTLKAVTYDNYNATSTAECIVSVVKKITTIVGDIDFESYNIGKTFTNNEAISNADYSGNAITFSGDNGKKEIAASGGNKFLKSGVSSDNATGGTQPYVAVTYGKSNAVIEYEADIIFSRNDMKHTGYFAGTQKDSTASATTETFYFTNEGKVKTNSENIGEYKANTWYRLKIKIDLPNHKYDFILTNLAEPSDKCERYGLSFASNLYKLNHVRIVGSFNAENPGYIGYDNIKTLYTASYPSITGFTDNLDTVGLVSCSAESLICLLSGAIGDITKDDITLENDYGVVTLESVEIEDDKITIKPKDGFVSSSRYKFTIKSSAPLADGSKFGFDTVAYFDVTSKALDVTGGSFTSNLSGITFTADIVNTTSQPKTVTLVTTTYKDGILINVYSKTLTLSETDTVTADTIASSASYDSVKAFVISDWSSGVPLSAKTFNFNK